MRVFSVYTLPTQKKYTGKGASFAVVYFNGEAFLEETSVYKAIDLIEVNFF